MLALRGVHPTVDSAEAALKGPEDADARPADRAAIPATLGAQRVPDTRVRRVLSPSAAKPPEQSWLDRLRSVASLLLAVAIWLMTWVLPRS
jgi:hypothetical protein